MSYEEAKRYSDAKVAKIREALNAIPNCGEIVVVCGSYARREACEHSDIDFFVIAPFNSTETRTQMEEIQDTVRGVVANAPSADGAFAQQDYRDQMLLNIGGDLDSNQKITRRILLLLEADWVANESGFKSLRDEILHRYISDGMKDHQLALFLLNDIIRYYRTVCVDFEFKTAEHEGRKPWGIRNIKLVFSRKLLYASGLFSVAMTTDRTAGDKRKVLGDLFNMPVIDRMIEICGRDKMNKVLQSYDRFLTTMADSKMREQLNAIKLENRDDIAFRQLKNEGIHFTRQLLALFENTFDATHHIRRAVIF